jgi:hypothetical protein
MWRGGGGEGDAGMERRGDAGMREEDKGDEGDKGRETRGNLRCLVVGDRTPSIQYGSVKNFCDHHRPIETRYIAFLHPLWIRVLVLSELYCP